MKTMLRKTLALLLCLCMCLSLVPAVFAEDDGIVGVDPLIDPETDDGIVTLDDEPADVELIPDDAETPDELVGDDTPGVPQTEDDHTAPDEAEIPDELVGDGVPDVPQTPDSDGEEILISGGIRDDETFALVSASGSWGNLTWTLDSSGTLTISGSGPMKYVDSTDAWRSYSDSIKQIVIKDGVTTIGESAFSNCSSLTSVTIPDNVTSIGNYAFRNCNSLVSVMIGNNVTNIGDYAFSNCYGLTSVTMPDSVTSIGKYAFSCSGLTSVTIVTSIGNGAFNGCSGLTSVTILDGVTTIGESAFSNCSSLTSVTIPDNVTSIGNYAFRNCNSLVSVMIGNNVTNIGDYAFSNCYGLTSVTMPDSVTSIGKYAFSCSGLTSVTIVTSIGNGAFNGCSGLTSVTILDSVTRIGDGAFCGCRGLTSVTIPDSVTRIGEDAFAYCRGLTNVTIPDSVTSIGRDAFYDCSSLKDIYYGGCEPQWRAILQSYNTNLTDGSVTIHYNSTGPGFGKIINSGDNPWIIDLECPFEDCVAQTASTEYNPNLSYYLAGLARAVYSESDIENSLRSLGFDYDNAEKEFDDNEKKWLSGYVVAKKTLSDNSNLVLITVRGSVGYNWNNLLRIGDSWTGTGQYPAIRGDAIAVRNALIRLFNGNIPTNNTTYVITGHSQGAGAANILAHELYYDNVAPSTIYCYTFACPNVACFPNDSHWNPGSIFDYIFNIENIQDLVPLIPSLPEDSVNKWGKYGRDRWFIPSAANSAIIGHDMLYYLRAMSDHAPFYYFLTKEQAKLKMSWLWRVIAGCCPVDMIVYDSSGNPVASVIDNQESYYDSEIGKILICINGDEKWFYLPPDQDYNIRVVATDAGEMTFKAYDYDMVGAEVLEEKTISSVALVPGKTMVSNVGGDIDTPDIKLYVLNDNDVPVCEVQEDGSETAITYSVYNNPYTKGSGRSVYITPITDNSFEELLYTKTRSYPTELAIGTTNKWPISNTNFAIQSGRLTFNADWLDSLSAGTYYLWGFKKYMGDPMLRPTGVRPIYLGYMQINAAEMSITVSPTSYTKNDPTAAPVAASGTAIPQMARFGIASASGSYTHVLSNNEYTLSGSTVTLSKEYLNTLADGTYCFIGLTSSNEQVRSNNTFTIVAVSASGSWGNLTWTLDSSGTLTISGSGPMKDFGDNSTDAWRSYSDSIKQIVIKDGVTSIGNKAFYGCTSLTSVTIPDGVTSIGSEAFSGCTSLTSVTIPEGVTSIGVGAFNGCSSLTSVTIPEGVTSIGVGAFSGCSSLTSVTIPEGVTSIGVGAFSGCSSLTSVTIPEGVTSIGGGAFSGCSSLTSVTIPEGVTSIDGSAFSGCSSLTSVTIPEGVTSIGGWTFSDCSSLTSVTIPEGVTSIGNYAFQSCSGLTDVYYTGTEAQWQTMSIGSYNDPLRNATIHYTPAAPVPTCTFSLNLQDVIGINFLVGGLTDYSGMTISWTKKDGTEISMPVTDGVLQSNGKYYFQLDLFAAKELARAVPVTITAADGTVLKEASCSVKSYCEKVQTMSGYGNLKALCAKMLEYGYAAQQLFQYDLANPILDAAPVYPAMAAPTASGDYKSGASKTLGGNGITGASANVSLESRIEFYITLKHDGTANLADYEITVDNSGKYTSVEKSNTGSGFLVKIKGINAKDLGTDFTVSAKKGGVVSSITVSPLTYCYVKQKSATATENAKNLSRGLYAYGHAARVYAGNPYM